VYVDEKARSCDSRGTVLAVYGFAHTAATWGPLAEEIFDRPPAFVCRIIALDLPAHGASPAPTSPALFGFLTLENYALAVLGALERLKAERLAPRAIIAHSQGAIVVQLAQQLLVGAGTSLRRAHNVDAVVLFAPTMPAALPWAFAENPATLQLLGGLLTFTPELGPHVRVPDALWPILFFSRLDGSIVSTAPTAADVAALGYNAPEPQLSALQLLGVLGFTRPDIASGVFSWRKGTLLTVLAFEQDQIVRPEEARALHAHLTGSPFGLTYLTIGGTESVHDMFVSDPGALFAGIRDALH
jgi:pimeloyl-ACP methyl ester carboxylesterase